MDSKVSALHSILDRICDQHCPRRRVRVRQGDPQLHTPLTIKLKRAKQRLYNDKNPAWKFMANLLQSKLQQRRRELTDKNINQAFQNSKQWWRNVSKLSNPAGSNTNCFMNKMFINNEWLTTGEFLENQIEYYASISNTVNRPPLPQSETTLDLVHIEEVKPVVKLALRKIDTTKANHSDDYPSWISKENAEDIAPPLTDIINSMLKSQIYPSLWKSAEIIPLPKTATPLLSKEFRPISLLWHCGKVAEQFVVSRLRRTTKGLLTEDQYAYSEGVGCTEALVDMISSWTKALDQRSNLCLQSLFVDFSKAFDMMDPAILDKKLQHLSINPGLRCLISSFLSDRSACAVIRTTGQKSEPRVFNGGVPQGTLLGPVLWTIFINDLPEKIQSSNATCKTTIYADDVTAYLPIQKGEVTLTHTGHRDRTLNAAPLQPVLNTIGDWSCENGMSLNASKTKSMNISICLNISSTEPLTINNTEIEEVSEFKLLGVTVDRHLSFAAHVENVFQKSRSKLHALLVLKRHGVSTEGLIRFYQANIRSGIIYAAPAWFSFLTDYSRKSIESIQRQCLRVIFPDLSYEERLSKAAMIPICDYLDTMCSSFVLNVATSETHRLKHHLPLRQSDIGRHSSRLRDVPKTLSNYNTTRKSLFSHYTVA